MVEEENCRTSTSATPKKKNQQSTMALRKYGRNNSNHRCTTDHDPIPKYICKVCQEQVEVTFIFATTGRINNVKHMENVTDLPSNDMLKTEYKKIMKLSVHDLFNKYQFDVKGLFDAVTSYLSDNNEDLSSTQNFDILINILILITTIVTMVPDDNLTNENRNLSVDTIQHIVKYMFAHSEREVYEYFL